MPEHQSDRRNPLVAAGAARLVVFAPNWLGDAVMALPALADVRRASPGVTVTIAARPSIAPLFEMIGRSSGNPDAERAAAVVA